MWNNARTLNTLVLDRGVPVTDGASFFSLPTDALYIKDGHRIILLKSAAQLTDENFRSQVRAALGSGRLNFLAPDFGEYWKTLREFDRDTFSWFVVTCEKKALSEASDSPSQTNFVQVVKPPLPSELKMKLTELWKRDYTATVLKDYSTHFQDNDLKSFSERLDEGSHCLFFDGAQIAAHGCWSEDNHGIFDLHCNYWHEWVAPGLPRLFRQQVHHYFFNALFSTGLPAMSGVAIGNHRALAHCLKNEMQFVMLSVRVPAPS